jgi:hypothetical protein
MNRSPSIKRKSLVRNAFSEDIVRRIGEMYTGNSKVVSDCLNWPHEYVKKILAGKLRPEPLRFLPVVSRLATLTSKSRVELINGLTNDLIGSSSNLLAISMIKRIADRGKTTSEIIKEYSLRPDIFSRIFNGTHLFEATTRAGLEKFLGKSEKEVSELIAQTVSRMRMPTASLSQLPAARPLCETLFEAIYKKDSNPTKWALENHLAPNSIRQLLMGEQLIVSRDFIKRIAKALQITDELVLAGLRLNVHLPPSPHTGLLPLITKRAADRNGHQIAKEIGISPTTWHRVLESKDYRKVIAMVMHQVRVWLDLSWAEFVQLAGKSQVDNGRHLTRPRLSVTSMLPEDQMEILFLRLYRKASPEIRGKTMELLSGASV